MDNRPDIWHKLREHQTPPPPELLRRLYEKIHALDKHVGTLKKLQQESIAPPSILRSIITSEINKTRPDHFRIVHPAPQPIRSLLSWRSSRKKWILGSIAASLVLLIAGFTLYKTVTCGSETAARNNKRNNAPVAPANTVQTADTLTSGDSALATITSTDSMPVAAADPAAPAGSTKHNWTLRLHGRSFHLVDNDPLVTFTSYAYPEIGNFLDEKAGEDIRINVDEYTNIVVSKATATMIREMYKTKSNGKPTRKARKLKQRLEDWKQTDEKHFEGTRFFNPADPMDLGEFIFK